MAHAYLFYGSDPAFIEEVGLKFAQQIFCESTTPPCGTCAACLGIVKGERIDSYSYFPSPKYNVEFVRELGKQVQYGPAVSPTLLVRLHFPEQLTPEAANAFLKLIEEPPPNVCFVFLSVAKNKLPLTLVSRCQTVFSPSKSAIPDKTRLPEVLQCSADDVSALSYSEKLALSEQFSAHKVFIPDLLNLWLDDCWRQLKKHPDQSRLIARINLLIEKLGELQYNVNLKLLLDALFLRI